MANGRPKIKIDWGQFDKLCELQCSEIEIAEWFGCTDETINNAVKREKGMLFSVYSEQKRGRGRISLRRKQFEVAQSGNVTMLIWLGKNWLGQTDKMETKSDNDGVFTAGQIEILMEQAKILSEGKLDEIKAQVRKEIEVEMLMKRCANG